MRDIAIEYVSLADQPAAMANGKIDAALMTEPYASIAEAHGVGSIVLPLDQLLPGFQVGLIFYNTEWAHRYPEDARRWMLAYVKGLRYYNDALRTHHGRVDLIGIITAHASIKDRAVWDRMVWSGLDPDGIFGTGGLLDYERWLLNEHHISQFVLPNRLADLSYVQYATKALGPYRP